MPSAKHTAANRVNSQKSTGPRTTAGQAASRYNAAKHGIVATTQIMFDESAEDLAWLAAEYHQHHSPADPGQRFLVDTLVNNEWRIRRMRRVEAELWEHSTNTFLLNHTDAPACTSGDAFATGSPTFERLQRVVNSCERVYHRALKELQRLQAQAKVEQTLPPATEPQKANPAPEPAPAAAAAPQPEPSTPASTAPKPPDAPPLPGQHAPANSAKIRPEPSDRFPDLDGSN